MATTTLIKKHTILVVDDKLLNVCALVIRLGQLGFAGDGSASGQDAILKVNEFTYAAIFMDLQMPEMSGFECAAHMRASERGTERRTPIIAYSALLESVVIEECLAAGMDAFLQKNCTPEQLENVLRRFVPDYPDLPNFPGLAA